jgi:dimethylargininase
VVDQAAVMTSMGADSRQAEIPAMAEELGRYRRIFRIERPARIDGGDVLIIGRRVYVGLSSRTNQAGIEALAGFLAPHGYAVAPILLNGALHLKSAVTALDDETLIINRAAVPLESFAGFRFVEAPESELGAANVLRIGDRILLHAGFERTVDKLESLGYRTRPVDVSELIKAESGVTCSSIIFSV